MAASEKVYVCGRCEDFGAPTLEELVVHMTNCGYPELRKKDDTNQSEDAEIALYEQNENSEGAVAALNISPEKKSASKEVVASPHSAYTSHSIDAGRSSPTPFIWNKKTALLLLKLVKDHKGDMESPYIRRKTVWQKIAVAMLDKYGFSVTAYQCENKFKNMSNRYRKARDNNLRPDGKLKQTCFLYNELDEFYRNDPRFNSSLNSRLKPKPVRGSRYMGSEIDYYGREPIITLSEGESSQILNNAGQSETEPVWVKRVIDSIEKWHNESMQMQREFIDVLKQILKK